MRRDADGRIIECDAKEFGQQLEDYFGGKYTRTQMEEVARWARGHNGRVLALVYRYCITNEETSYGKPPTLKALNRNLKEVFDSYPEVLPTSANKQPLIEEAPRDSDLGEWFEAWRKAQQRGVNPWHSDEVNEVLRRHGVS